MCPGAETRSRVGVEWTRPEQIHNLTDLLADLHTTRRKIIICFMICELINIHGASNGADNKCKLSKVVLRI